MTSLDDGETVSEKSGEDTSMDSFQEWQLGIFLLFIVVFMASISATILQYLEVPFGTEIGVLGGAILTFLALSYWYYGR